MDVATQEVVTPQAPVETPSPGPSSEPASIAELSEQTFGPTPTDDSDESSNRADRDRRWSGRFASGAASTEDTRRRARSHQAGPKDTEQIAAQTKRLREAESELGLKIEKQPGESDRVFALRRQAEIVEALRDERKSKSAPSQTPRQPSESLPTTELPAFEDKEPQPEDFANEANPFAAYVKAMSAYEWKRQIHEAQKTFVSQQQSEQQRAVKQRWEDHGKKVEVEINEFAKTHPDYWQVMDSIEDIKVPDVLMEAITTSDNRAALNYHLGKNPDELIDLVGFSAGLGYSPESVALVRRRLKRLAQTIGATPSESKGAPPSVPSPVIVAPRPPTPLGAGSMKTREEPPAEPASIEEMRRFYHKDRR